MTLYTVMPHELIWREEDHSDQTPQTKELQMGNVLMEVELLGDNKAKVIRLLNCELGHYLNPHYTPGSIISFLPVIEQTK